MNNGVRLPFSWKSFARLNLEIGSSPTRASRFEVAVRASTARVHHPLGNAFAIEMRDLFQEVVVLEHRWTSVANGAIVLVVVDGMALSGSQIRARGPAAAHQQR